MPPLDFAITGASGFVGQALMKALAAAGFHGIAISRRPVDSHPDGWLSRSRDEMLAERRPSYRPDCVIHLEVKQHVLNPTAADIQLFEDVNVGGTNVWLDWCSRNDIRKFIYFSTIKAVGSSTYCLDEAANGEANTPYGKSKRAAEEQVVKWAIGDSARAALILRPAVIYGPGNKGNISSMVQAIDRGKFFLVGDCANIKSLISLRNLSAAVCFLQRRIKPGCNVYNLVDRESYSVRQIANFLSGLLTRRSPSTMPVLLATSAARTGDIFQRLTGRDVPITTSCLRALLETTHFSPAKLASTGFVHPQSTEEGLAELVRWYRS